ncbi:MAG: hypothetical protein LIO72_06420 [Ruminococcus sp.]|nr:hypothetical protein [Ruminococcus sp.]
MSKYETLLSDIADKYGICKGDSETVLSWEARFVYSICGTMAYASLWDNPEDESVSIVHMKKRIRSIFNSYISLYQELSRILPDKSGVFENEIADLFRSVGVVYHMPNRIVASQKHEEAFKNILFQRGIAIDNIDCVSSIGFYSESKESGSVEAIKDMFGLERKSLQELWQSTISHAFWKESSLQNQPCEYLRLKPPFSQGYWVNRADYDKISILRTGMKGAEIYYLYRIIDDKLEVSQLPEWQVESHNYMALSNACLASNGTLPPIKYTVDGELVHIQLGYLLPPRELGFLKLYSYPEDFLSQSYNFNRKLSTEVFEAIEAVLSDEGYEFKKG